MPESAGLYFSWGNTDGHPAGAGYDFSQAAYATTPGAEITEDLTLDQDAARANIGVPWRMPTAEEFQELNDNCTSVWTTLNGVNGRLFTSNVNGNTLFIPAAGGYSGTSLNARGTYGFYWSSTYYSATRCRDFSFNNLSVTPQNNSDRQNGFSIRAVQDGTPNRSVVRPTTVSEPKEEETPTEEEPKDDNQR